MAMNWLNARYDARGRLEDVTKTLVEVDRLVAEILLQIQEIIFGIYWIGRYAGHLYRFNANVRNQSNAKTHKKVKKMVHCSSFSASTSFSNPPSLLSSLDILAALLHCWLPHSTHPTFSILVSSILTLLSVV